MIKRIIMLSAIVIGVLLLVVNTGTVAAQSYCNWASYVADITVPDGTVLPPGASFKKIWRIKNIGTCTWNEQYKLAFVSGNQLGASSEINLPQSVAPGGSIDLILDMVSPSSEGTYYSYWRFKNASGEQFGIGSSASGVIWTKIKIEQGVSSPTSLPTTSAATFTPTATSGVSLPTSVATTPSSSGYCDWAKFMADVTFPDNTMIGQNLPFTKVWRFRNDGNCTWTTGYKIYFSSGKQMGSQTEVSLPKSVAPGETVDVVVNMTSPSETGTFFSFWKFKNASGQAFGIGTSATSAFWLKLQVVANGPTAVPYNPATTATATPVTPTATPVTPTPQTPTATVPTTAPTIAPTSAGTSTATSIPATPTYTSVAPTATPTTVSSTPDTNLPTVSPGSCDLAGSVQDLTIPDDTVLNPGQEFIKTWRVKNVGTCAWTSAYRLAFVAGELMNAPSEISLPNEVQPGSSVDISVSMKAPADVGTYTGYWKLKNASGQVFGAGSQGTLPLWVKIKINSIVGTATPTPTATPSAQVCDWASVVTDVTVPDGTVFFGGDKFVKTWRLKNIGTCTWTTDYKLVYDSGNQMSGPNEVNLPKTVAPGSTVDVSVNLQAPNWNSNYIGYWKLKNANGTKFGVGKSTIGVFWVKIVTVDFIRESFPFYEKVCDATWVTNYGAISCPSAKENYSRGSVTIDNNPYIEGGSNRKDQPTIITIPPDGSGGYIQGTFPPFQIHKGDNLTTMMGCLDNAPKCDVTFELGYLDIDGNLHYLVEPHGQTLDGYMTNVNMMLDDMDGQVVQFVFKVSNNKTSLEDRAFWFFPTIWRR